MLPYLHLMYISLGPVKIYTWGLFVSLGFLAATLFLIKKYPTQKDHFVNILLYVLISAIIGARLFFVVFYSAVPAKDIFKIWQGGMSSFGGFIGGVLAIFIYCRYKKLNLYELFSKAAFALPLGLAIARVGCFLLNEHPGIKTIASPISVAYPDGPRFDLGLILMLFDALLFIYFLLKRKGFYLECLLAFYGFGRFFLDFLRVGETTYAGLLPSQYGSILMLGIALYLIIKNKRYGFYK
ncbi:MAG: prolipoprotein diacylglyceryl transferase family protein [bacterium]